MQNTGRIRPWVITVATILVFAGIVWATTIKPALNYGGMAMQAQTTCVNPAGSSCVFTHPDGGLVFKPTDDGGVVHLGAGSSGDITAVVAGTGLSGGATSGSATLAIDSTVATLTGSQVLTNKTIASIATGAANGAYTCAAADGAGFIGFGIDTTNAISNGAARLLKVSNNTAVKFSVDPTGNIYMNSAGGAGIVNASNTIAIIPTASEVKIYGGAVMPYDNAIQACGTVAKRWNSVGSYWFDTKDGAQLTAASSITPTAGLHHVTGATTISTIAVTNVPETNTANARITLIADDGTITWDNGGNISIGGTISQFFAQDFVWHNSASKWYPVK